jgi:hypothetical protein
MCERASSVRLYHIRRYVTNIFPIFVVQMRLWNSFGKSIQVLCDADFQHGRVEGSQLLSSVSLVKKAQGFKLKNFSCKHPYYFDISERIYATK